MMQGLKDPLKEEPTPNIVHTVFRRNTAPYPEYNKDVPSALFKINQVGYLPDKPKFAYLGAWLGPVYGPWRPTCPMSNWKVINAQNGAVAYESANPPVLRVPDDSVNGVFSSGEETYEMDFSTLFVEGEYYIVVDGIGRSETFRIAASSAEDAFRVHMQGLYQKRCAIAKEEPYTHWTANACHMKATRGVFPPDEGKLEPKCKWFDIIKSNTDWEKGEKLSVVGGWHDAADYDRRPQHLNIVNDLCAVYLAKKGNFRDGQLAIPENSNGIADILDEAEWGLRHILAGQRHDGGAGTWIEGTRHPRPGNVASEDAIDYALSRATRKSSLMYASMASVLMRCDDRFREKYLESAKKAWNFAMSAKPQTDLFEVRQKLSWGRTKAFAVQWRESDTLPSEYLVKAAVNLAALTGDSSYIVALTPYRDKIISDVKFNSWNWSPLVFIGEMLLGTPEQLEEFFKIWRSKVLRQADTMCTQIATAHAYRMPWPKLSDKKCPSMGWAACHPLRRAQYLIAAHAMTGNAKYLDAASIANDFHNGCNMQGTTLTSGLGRVYPVKFLDLPSYVDGVAEYTPGITPYRWTTKIPPKALELVWNKDEKKASRWPKWRCWWNLENQTVAASEFTVWETIAPAASVTGYLSTPSSSSPPIARRGAGNISDLPGYWLIP